MNGFLLDTNVVSELIKSEPNGNVLRWIDETDEIILFLSVLTLGEIRNGIERLNPGKRRGRLESWLTVDLRLRFHDRILTVNEAIAERWGALAATAAKKKAGPCRSSTACSRRPLCITICYSRPETTPMSAEPASLPSIPGNSPIA